jgi:hypothetical protein
VISRVPLTAWVALFVVMACLSTAPRASTSPPRQAVEVVLTDPPSWRGSGIVHARFLLPDGTVAAEEWLDRASDATRRVQREPGPISVGWVKVTRGKRTQSWNSLAPARVYEYRAGSDVDDPWLLTSSDLLYAWRMLAAGRAQVVGSGNMGPRQTVHVRVDPPARAAHSGHVVAELDASLHLPLRFMAVAPNSVSTINVELAFLRAREAPDDLFSFRTWQFRQTRVAYERLACPVRFPVYGLGERHRDLRFDLGGAVETKRYRGRKTQVATELFLPYARERHAGDPELNMSEQAADTRDARARLRVYQRLGTPTRIRVAGGTRTLYVFGSGGSKRSFGIVIGRTLVKGVTTLTSAEVTDAVRDLKRLVRRNCRT